MRFDGRPIKSGGILTGTGCYRIRVVNILPLRWLSDIIFFVSLFGGKPRRPKVKMAKEAKSWLLTQEV
jgi:hypothetical protein